MIRKIKFDKVFDEVILRIGGKEFSFFNTNKVFLDVPIDMLDVISPDLAEGTPFYLTVRNDDAVVPDRIMIGGILYSVIEGRLVKL